MAKATYTDLVGKISNILDRYNVMDIYSNEKHFSFIGASIHVQNANGLSVVLTYAFIFLLAFALGGIILTISYYIKSEHKWYKMKDHINADGNHTWFVVIALFVASLVYLAIYVTGETPVLSNVDYYNLKDYEEQITAFYESNEEEIIEYKSYEYTSINFSKLPEVLIQTKDSIKTVPVYKYKVDPSLKEPILMKVTLKKEYTKLKLWGIHNDYAVLFVPEGFDIVNNQTGFVTSEDKN